MRLNLGNPARQLAAAMSSEQLSILAATNRNRDV